MTAHKKKKMMSTIARLNQWFTPRYITYGILAILGLIALQAIIYYTSPASDHRLPPNDYLLLDTDLSSRQIHYIHEDNDGYIWICAERGLNRYDGQHFQQYYATADTTSLPNSLVMGMQEVMNNPAVKIVNTYNGACLLFPDNTSLTLTSNQGNVKQYDDTTFVSICEDEISVIDVDWEHRTETIVRERNIANRTTILHVLPNKAIWVISQHLVEKFDIQLNLLSQTEIDNFGYTSYPRSEKEVWLITPSGFKALNLETGQIEKTRETEYISDRVSIPNIEMVSIQDSIVILKDKNHPELKLFNLNTFTEWEETFDRLKDNHIDHAIIDSKGNLWCGSRSLGVDVHFARRSTFSKNNKLSQFFSNRGITSIMLHDDGTFYALVHRSKVYICPPDGNDIREIDTSPLGVLILTHLTSLHNGHTLFISYQNAIECDINDKGQLRVIRRLALPSNIHSIIEGDNGMLWAACSDGCYLINPKDGSLRKLNIILNSSNVVKELADHRIAFGSLTDGISVIDPQTMQERHYELPLDKPSLFSCRDMTQDQQGNLWIATIGMGIFRLDLTTGLVENFRAPNMCTDVSCILSDPQSGNIWLGTLDGLSRFDPVSCQFLTFHEADGVQGNEFFERCAISDKQGTFYFGGKQGLTIFVPSQVTPQMSHTLLISTIMVGSNILSPGTQAHGYTYRTDAHGMAQELTVPHDMQDLKLCLSTLNFGDFSQSPIMYRLDGYDESWQWALTPDIIYKHLQPGDYTFEARSLDQNGNIVAGIALPITVSPDWWQSWWFTWILYPLLALLVLTLAYLMISNAIQRRHRIRDSLREKVAIRYASDMNMRFFTNMAHEFRTPLTLISGANSLIEKSGHTDDERHALQIISSNTTRLLKLVNQLLDFNKLERDMVRLCVQPVHVQEIVGQVVQNFQIGYQEHGIQLTVNYENLDDAVWIDPEKYDNILTNLLSNALKFTPKGGSVTISVKGEGDTMTTEVSDTGIGIPDNMLESIFDRYYQTTAGAMKQNATGIGLCYCRGLARLHRGSIVARHNTDAEQGSTFVLTLPVVREAYQESEINTHMAEASASASETEEENNENNIAIAGNDDLSDSAPVVLVVDDEPEVISFMRLILRGTYRVVTESNATDAIASLTEIKPDIIVSDVMMLGMDGFKFCQLIKEDVAYCHIPVILLTAKVSLEERIEGLNVGADAYVTKPFEPAYLLALIRSMIDNRRRVQHLLLTNTTASSLKKSLPVDATDEPSDLTLAIPDDELSPDEAMPGAKLSAQDTKFMDTIYEYMEKHLSDAKLDIDELVGIVMMSRSKFFYKIKGLTGESPNAFFKIYKLNRAAEMIRNGDEKLTYIAELTGFCGPSHFASSFKNQFGVLPSEYANAHK